MTARASDVRLTVVLSDALNADLERSARIQSTTKAIALQKAIALYLAAAEGKSKGLKVGLAKPGQRLEIEFVGV